ncbi:hypothetical protein JW905_02505 [bacterium]|nr:hypothetical protein [candidate division CSSED10-310 bacterium]
MKLHSMFICVCVMTGFLAMPAPVHADWETNVGIIQGSQENGFQDMVLDGSGNAHFVWSDMNYVFNPHTTQFEVHWYTWYAMWHKIGGLFSPQVKLGETNGHHCATQPSLTFSDDGILHVVWSASPWSDQNWGAEKRKIMYTRKFTNEMWQPAPVQISPYWYYYYGATSQCMLPQVLTHGNEVHVIWYGRPTTQHVHNYLDVFWNHSLNSGRNWAYGQDGYNVTGPPDTGVWALHKCWKQRAVIAPDGDIFLVYQSDYKYISEEIPGNEEYHWNVIAYREYDGSWSGEELLMAPNWADHNWYAGPEISYTTESGSYIPHVIYNYEPVAGTDYEADYDIHLNYRDPAIGWKNDQMIFSDPWHRKFKHAFHINENNEMLATICKNDLYGVIFPFPLHTTPWVVDWDIGDTYNPSGYSSVIKYFTSDSKWYVNFPDESDSGQGQELHLSRGNPEPS